MLDDPETLLFVRFRDRADVDALGRLYDATAAELLRVAMHLVRDPGRAEDLVQQTFVAAIEAAQRFDASRRVRAWLLGILANLARKLQREEARVPERPAETGIDPVALAATEEFTAQVDAAISTLPEVYQPVLVLHLKHGMIAAEIAHALRRAPGTVRTQLVRALELLKKALPASVAIAGCVLFTPLRGLAAVKQVVLANAVTHVAAGGVAGAGIGVGVASLVGGTVAMKKLVTTLVLTVLVCAGAFAWLEAGRSVDANATQRDAPSPVQAALPVPDAPSAAAAAPMAAEREQLVAPTHGSLRYRFLWEEDHTPAVGVFVQFVVWGRQNPHSAAIEAQTDSNGEIARNDIEPGRVSVGVDRAGGPGLDVVAGQQSTGTYLIPRGVTVDVLVQDEQQQPIPGARVWLSHYGNHTEGHEVAVTNATGRVAIRDAAQARYIGVRADGYAPPDLQRVEGKPGERVALTLTMAAGGATLHGVVRDAKAQPVVGARVWICGFANVTKSDPGVVSAAPPPPFDLRTDASGRFEARGLPAAVVVLRARAPTSGTSCQQVSLRAGEAQHVDVTLPAGATITGLVRDERGQGIPGAWISGAAEYDGFGRCSTCSTADGSFTLQGLTPGCSLNISASQSPFLGKRESFVLSEGELRTFDFVLEASRADDQISGQLVDSNGAPLVKWVVEIRSRNEQNTTWNAWLPTDADGRFVARGCREEQCRLQVFGPGGKGVPFPLVAMDVVRGTSDLRVCVPAAALERATLSGQVVDADGKPVVDASVNVHEPGVRTFRSCQTDSSGCFRTDPLPPRTYRLDVSGRGMPVVQLGERKLAPKEDLDLGTIVLPRGGRVALRCTGVAAERRWWAAVHADTGECVGGLDETTEPRQSNLLAPGRYELCVGGEGVGTVAQSIEIVDGKTTSIEIALERGVEHSIELRGPKDGWQKADVVISDAQGRRVCTFEDLTAPHACSICLGLGMWHVRATTDTGLAATATVSVADVAAAPGPVVLELR